jgi:hypothetical protein
MITSKKCWCQSGKSYDNCCKQIEQNYNPKLAQALISKFGTYLTNQPWFADIVTTEIDKYYLDNGEFDIDEHVFGAVIENLIFESDVYGKTPLQLFIESPGIAEYELIIYKDWLANNVLSAFEVVDTVKGKAILLKDLLHNDKIYFVLENTVSIIIEKGSFICCRLVPFLGKHIILGGFSAGLPEQFVYTLVRNQDNNPINGIPLTRIMYGINHLNKKNDKKKISPKKAKDLFLSYCQEKKIDIKENQLESIFTYEDKAEKFIEKALALLETNTDKQTFFELWQDARIFYTNDTNTNFKQGPIEEMLVNQMMIELQQDILSQANKSSKFQTPNKVYKISDIKIDQWLSKNQKELNNKTAKQAILEERKLLNNPRKDFSYKVTFSLTKESTGDSVIDLLSEATQKLEVDKDYLGALDTLGKINESELKNSSEAFRVYNNIAVCLINIGAVKLGKKALQKAVKLNPEYLMAQENLNDIKNLSNFEDTWFKYWLYYVGYNKLPIKSLKDSDFDKDAQVFLQYAKKGVALTTKLEEIKLAICKEINLQFVNPEDDVITIDYDEPKYFKRTHEGQYFKVDTLHDMFLSSDLAYKRKQQLFLNTQGQKLKADQILASFFVIWVTRSTLNDNTTFHLPNILYLLFKYLDKHGKIDLTKNNLAKTLGINLDKENEEHETWSLVFITDRVFRVLIWMNIVEQKRQEDDKYVITKIGKKFAQEIEEGKKLMISDNIKKLLSV